MHGYVYAQVLIWGLWYAWHSPTANGCIVFASSSWWETEGQVLEAVCFCNAVFLPLFLPRNAFCTLHASFSTRPRTPESKNWECQNLIRGLNKQTKKPPMTNCMQNRYFKYIADTCFIHTHQYVHICHIWKYICTHEDTVFKMCMHTGKNPPKPHQNNSLGQSRCWPVLPFNILPSELRG